jgi:hypothetical protein
MRLPPVLDRLSTLAFIEAGIGLLYAVVLFLVGAIGAGLAVVVFAGLAVACGLGLRTFQPWARWLAVVSAVLGLLGVVMNVVRGAYVLTPSLVAFRVVGLSIVTAFHVLVLLYLFKPGVRLLYSGRRGETREVHELADTWPWLALVIGVFNIFLILAVVGLAMAIGIPGLRGPSRTTDTAGVQRELLLRYQTFEGLPQPEVEPLLRTAHETCYAPAYQGGLFSKRFDRAGYGECIGHVVGQRLARLATLHSPQFLEHTDPRWWKLSFTIEANEGFLPPAPTLKTGATCPGKARSDGESGTSRDLFEKTGERSYRTETMVLKDDVPCHYQVRLAYAEWDLGPALEVDGPAPGSVLPPVAVSTTPMPATGGGGHILEISGMMVRANKNASTPPPDPGSPPPPAAAIMVDVIVNDAADDFASNPLNASLTADCDRAGSIVLAESQVVSDARAMGTGKVLLSVPAAIPLDASPRECEITVSVRHATGVDAIHSAHYTLR